MYHWQLHTPIKLALLVKCIVQVLAYVMILKNVSDLMYMSYYVGY